MKNFLLAFLLVFAPLAASAEVDDVILSPHDAEAQCESWNFKASMHGPLFHKAPPVADTCHYRFDEGHFSRNAVEFCKSQHSQGVIDLLFVRCLDAFPQGPISADLIKFCDKTFYDWTNNESNPAPVPAFGECLAKMQGKTFPDETVQALKECQKIKKGFGDGEGHSAYDVWLTMINRCVEKAIGSSPNEE